MEKKIILFFVPQMWKIDGRGIPTRAIMFVYKISQKSIIPRRLSQIIISDGNDVSNFSYGHNNAVDLKLVLFWCMYKIVIYSTIISTHSTWSVQSAFV